MRDLVRRKMMARSQQSKQTNQKYGNINCAVFRNWLKYRTLQYLFTLFCKSGYILAGARFVIVASFRPEPKSGTALVLLFLAVLLLQNVTVVGRAGEPRIF